MRPAIGVTYSREGDCQFRVWAPLVQRVEVHLLTPQDQLVAMEKKERGYFQAFVEGVKPGSLYFYRLDGQKDRPDPASRFQPKGVHGPSQIIDQNLFQWEDKSWCGIPLEKMVIYELHVGTFTPEGTFAAILQRLEDLCYLGINTLNIMPVAQFSGERNWGYDGVFPFAVQNSYGGPEGPKKLVQACHLHDMAVVLDVVYNHFGPEGNYLGDFCPYFTEKYQTPWGWALNFDDAHSDGVRNFFIENALFWFRDFHLDALRLDAIHAIYDFSAKPFLQELAEKVGDFSEERGRKFFLIAESDLNDVRVIRPRELGGYGIDAQWCDDFHHSLHTLLTREKTGYYIDFGKVEHLTKAFREGFVYAWEYSEYRKRHHGSSSKDRPPWQFIVFSQNHDQVGNRMLGERLSKLVSFEALKLAAGAALLSPYIPLIFMGEEYAEESPFLYFVSHSDPALIAAVREGRKAEFKAFRWPGEPPDPQNPETFFQSKLKWEKRREGKYNCLLEFYRRLIELRQTLSPLTFLSKEEMEVLGFEKEEILLVRRWKGNEEVFIVFNFGDSQRSVDLPVPAGNWRKQLDSEEESWGGKGSFIPGHLQSEGEITLSLNPKAFILFTRTEEA